MTRTAASSSEDVVATEDGVATIAADVRLLRQVMSALVASPQEALNPEMLSSAFAAPPQQPLNPQMLLNAFAAARRLARLLRQSKRVPTHPLSPVCNALTCEEIRLVLEDWVRDLPRIQGWLLAERQRLSSRRAHAAAVRDWANLNQRSR